MPWILECFIGSPLVASKNVPLAIHWWFANYNIKGIEDPKVIKLILYLLEDISGLAINFQKTSIYLVTPSLFPEIHLAQTHKCSASALSVTYLEVPILGKRPRHYNWEILISKIWSRQSTWKSRFISIKLVNLVLSSIPYYCMFIFKLPIWTTKKIDHIRIDFLCLGLTLTILIIV